jgi:alkanesulfonate monooxygenase SsuD/methylene tetrahydromethanopterin reductase-like flavin-dependent oxidoreductase (luciferase family)
LVQTGLVCDAVRGLFLAERDTGALRATAERAGRAGVDVLFLRDGPLGDAIVVATAVGSWVPGVLLGVRIDLGSRPHRHPAVLAREMTTFDRVSGGRAMLAFTAPFTGATAEAAALCRAMWTEGIAVGTGPHYPVAGAVNRPLPEREGGPPIALDLTDGLGAAPPAALLALCDLVLVPAAPATPGAAPPGVDVCEIQGA